MRERKLENKFIEGLEAYPFATHIKREVPVSGGRADIRLPDYNVVIEAKGDNGNTKKAIGQALWYAEELDDIPYVLLPAESITNTTQRVCERAEVGILTATTVPRMVYDVGGLEPFNIYDFKGAMKPDPDASNKPPKTLVVGPSQETINNMRQPE